MNILVTGGLGRIGRTVVRDLLEAGHTVTNVDRAPKSADPPQAAAAYHYMQVDLTDAGQVYQALAHAQAQAVIHLGAWSNAGMAPDTRTYGDNVQGIFNLFQACADLGIRRVVAASSAQVYGLDAAPPHYLPLDEAHPLRPTNCYALSKMAGEQAADYFCRRRGLEILSFRFMGVRPPEGIPGDVQAIRADPAGDRRLLWTRCDARDAAVVCRMAVEAAQVEPGPYNISGGQVMVEQATAALVQEYFGPATELRAELPGRRSPLSCAKAGRLLGWQPVIEYR